MRFYDRCDDDPEIESLRYEVFYQKQYQSKLTACPDCRDPDHPGCYKCQETDDECESDN